ncbi:AraC-like ligand-binding domain-containing protein [Streptomyces europaeiscabiei]|uniref:AraC-like ligand-binding domain-containing protein n=1 Tax=Streptomyces europaeiscabiei TaxID=146819 RepID=UPI000766032B|nr:helix-turn-helix domain-containing protein [Streptomyces europaeiscabiei]MDX3665239.1 helix-turn-helix domain-containing protein [Streptomyces europaeiscabiei]
MPTVTTPPDGSPAERFDFWRTLIKSSFVPLDAVPHETPDFRGRLRSARLGPVQVSVVEADPHGVTHTRRHIAPDLPDLVKVSLQLSGQCALAQKDRQVLLKPGGLALYDTRFPYTLEFEHPYRQLVLMLPRALLRLPEAGIERVTAVPVPCRTGVGPVVLPFLRGLAQQVEELESVAAPRFADTVVDLLQALLAPYGEAPPGAREEGRDVLTRRILMYMEQRLTDPHLGPDEIAAAHHISRRYLYKLLAEQGHTVSGWIRERRLTQCRRDLTDPALAHLPVAAIGGRWGYPDPAYFSHAFKSVYGMSPREARVTPPCP